MDKYQLSYLGHQQLKKQMLTELMKERHSERMFSEKDVDDITLNEILKTKDTCPSSCNRKAIETMVVRDKDYKSLLGGVLVGGVGWVHRAPVVVLLFADPVAYKASETEKDWMSFIDAGIVVQQYYLMATALGLKCCYINPSIREINRRHFMKTFSVLFGDFEDPYEGVFCGAMAIGWPRDGDVSVGSNQSREASTNGWTS